jgi:hypothetical protein
MRMCGTFVVFALSVYPLAVSAHDITAHSSIPQAIPASRSAPHSLAQGGVVDAPVQLKNIRSVLGIEVRSSHEKNIGRVVDLLADRSGAVEAAVIEFGGFLGIGMRKIAISWSDLRFETDGKQLVAVLDIPRDQLRAASDYKPDQPNIVTKVIDPLMPSTEPPPPAATEPPTVPR